MADYTDPRELPALVRRRGTCLVLLDLDLGRGSDGLALVAPLCAEGARVLVVSGTTHRAALGAAVESGAVGWVGKSAPFGDLVAAVRRAAEGRTVVDSAARAPLLDELARHRQRARDNASALARLSPRETDVLAELVLGRTATQIAADHVVSVATVRTQIRAVLTKLGVSSQLAAAALARSAGFEKAG